MVRCPDALQQVINRCGKSRAICFPQLPTEPLQTGRTRLRPILMTALTTILAMVTMALGLGDGAEMTQPMAIVTIGGLTYATLLTLLVVPVLYDVFHKRPMKKVDLEDDLS